MKILNVKLSKQFKKDRKRIINNPELLKKLDEAISLLARQIPLPDKYRDHALIGKYQGYRDCHVAPDCVLIYKKVGGKLLLARIGKHTSVFDM